MSIQERRYMGQNEEYNDYGHPLPSFKPCPQKLGMVKHRTQVWHSPASYVPITYVSSKEMWEEVRKVALSIGFAAFLAGRKIFSLLRGK